MTTFQETQILTTQKSQDFFPHEKESPSVCPALPLTLFINTDNPNRKLLVCCKREDNTSIEFMKEQISNNN